MEIIEKKERGLFDFIYWPDVGNEYLDANKIVSKKTIPEHVHKN